MISPQFTIEDALASLLTPISGLNVYVSNRRGARFFPYVTIRASIGSQLVVPTSGVYEIPIELKYSDTTTRTNQTNFESNYFNIFSELYSPTPTLALKIQDKSINTKVYMARITSQTPTIRTDKRAWERGLVLSVIATPAPLVDGLRDYDFSEALNSFYIATI
jgi:hypothetical protein